MSGYPRARTETPPPPFWLDRIVAYVILAVYAVGFILTVLGLQRGWSRAQDAGAIGPVGYLESRWSTHAYYLLEIVRIVWVGLGLIRGRPWAIVALFFVSSMSLVVSIPRAYWFNIASMAPMLAYALLRLLWLGPRHDRFDLRERVVTPPSAP